MTKPMTRYRCWFAGTMWYAVGRACVDLNREEGDFDPCCDTWTGRDDYVLMEYVGAQDSAGRLIYDGDVLRSYHFTDMRNGKVHYLYHAVEWWPRRLGWGARNAEDPGTGDGSPALWVLMKNAADITVVGNIYENPELMKRSADNGGHE